MTQVALALLAVPIAWFLYGHCARPILARHAAPSVAFGVMAIAASTFLVVSLIRGVLSALIIASDRSLSFRDWAPLLDYGPVLALVPLALAIYAPELTVRLSGGRDRGIPRRYLIDQFGGEEAAGGWGCLAGARCGEGSEPLDG